MDRHHQECNNLSYLDYKCELYQQYTHTGSVFRERSDGVLDGAGYGQGAIDVVKHYPSPHVGDQDGLITQVVHHLLLTTEHQLCKDR